MRNYKEIRFCKICNARFIVDPENKRIYNCNSCQEKYKKGVELEEKKILVK